MSQRQQQQQQLLKQDMTISQILRTFGKQFRQIQNLYSDGANGRCIASSIALMYLSAFIWFSSSLEDLFAQQQGTISVIQATALPLVNTEGNQVKLIINYSIGDESIVGQRINAQMGIYDRINGTLIKLTSFPDGFVLNSTEGTIQMASTLTDPKIQNISTIVTLTNEAKTEKYSNDVRSDLDMRAILPTALPEIILNETLTAPPAPAPPPPQPPSSSAEDDSDSNSNEDE
jgi:hypothetical protein